MTDLAALYREVLARPHDDTPRLVFADYVEENGGPCPYCHGRGRDRVGHTRTTVFGKSDVRFDVPCFACHGTGHTVERLGPLVALIRLQIESAKLGPDPDPNCPHPTGSHTNSFGWRRCSYCHNGLDARIEATLRAVVATPTGLSAPPFRLRQSPYTRPGVAVETDAGRLVGLVEFARGFVDLVRLSATGWQDWADRLTAAFPLTRVVLGSWPELAVAHSYRPDGDLLHFRLDVRWAGRRAAVTGTLSVRELALIRSNPDGAGDGLTPRIEVARQELVRTLTPKAFLERVWPGITFSVAVRPTDRGGAAVRNAATLHRLFWDEGVSLGRSCL